MVKKILSYLLSLVIAFNFTLKKSDAHFLLGMYVGYLIANGLYYKIDRSDCEKILQWQLDKCQKKLKEEQNIPIEETIARNNEKIWRCANFMMATFGLLGELFNLPYFHPLHPHFCPQTKPADDSKKNKENSEKNQSKAEEPKVDNKQKS